MPTSGLIISNASPLIAFEQMGLLDVWPGLFLDVVAPPAVLEEIAPTVRVPAWLKCVALTQPVPEAVRSEDLGRGESETIALAIESNASAVILDDLAARRLAQALGLRVIGSLGLLVEAKHRGLVELVRPPLDRLMKKGFRVSPRLCEAILLAASE